MKHLTRKQIASYFENNCAFRDYTFKPGSLFGKTGIRASINLKNPNKHDLDDAISIFCRDGYSTIIVYLDSIKTPKQKPKPTLKLVTGGRPDWMPPRQSVAKLNEVAS